MGSPDAGLVTGIPDIPDGGVPAAPATVAPDEDDVVGVGFMDAGDAVVGFCVTGDGNEVAVEAVGKMHDPELGFAFVIMAVPPKSQLVWEGFLR